jgi:hypothetical protein
VEETRVHGETTDLPQVTDKTLSHNVVSGVCYIKKTQQNKKKHDFYLLFIIPRSAFILLFYLFYLSGFILLLFLVSRNVLAQTLPRHHHFISWNRTDRRLQSLFY